MISYLTGLTAASLRTNGTPVHVPSPSTVGDTIRTAPGPRDGGFTETIIGPNGKTMTVPKAAR
jgi:hypothetical protein